MQRIDTAFAMIFRLRAGAGTANRIASKLLNLPGQG
jgi:hypothetical protein